MLLIYFYWNNSGYTEEAIYHILVFIGKCMWKRFERVCVYMVMPAVPTSHSDDRNDVDEITYTYNGYFLSVTFIQPTLASDALVRCRVRASAANCIDLFLQEYSRLIYIHLCLNFQNVCMEVRLRTGSVATAMDEYDGNIRPPLKLTISFILEHRCFRTRFDDKLIALVNLTHLDLGTHLRISKMDRRFGDKLRLNNFLKLNQVEHNSVKYE